MGVYAAPTAHHPYDKVTEKYFCKSKLFADVPIEYVSISLDSLYRVTLCHDLDRHVFISHRLRDIKNASAQK